jgi:hypothetical protein
VAKGDEDWREVPDEQVRFIWEYDKHCCQSGQISVRLYDIVSAGLPICPDCGRLLDYVRTEVRTEEQ